MLSDMSRIPLQSSSRSLRVRAIITCSIPEKFRNSLAAWKQRHVADSYHSVLLSLTTLFGYRSSRAKLCEYSRSSHRPDGIRALATRRRNISGQISRRGRIVDRTAAAAAVAAAAAAITGVERIRRKKINQKFGSSFALRKKIYRARYRDLRGCLRGRNSPAFGLLTVRHLPRVSRIFSGYSLSPFVLFFSLSFSSSSFFFSLFFYLFSFIFFAAFDKVDFEMYRARVRPWRCTQRSSTSRGENFEKKNKIREDSKFLVKSHPDVSLG